VFIIVLLKKKKFISFKLFWYVNIKN
jgi:hypothetical protein